MSLSSLIIWLPKGTIGKVVTASVLFGLSPTLFWLALGAVLCSVELLLPTAFIAFVMGLSALLVAVIATVIPYPQWQVLIWLALSTVAIFLSRRFLPKGKARSIEGATQAKTMGEILPGQTGRVIYEGNSWRARCADDKVSLSSNQKVYVVGREGTTLIVMPEQFLDS